MTRFAVLCSSSLTRPLFSSQHHAAPSEAHAPSEGHVVSRWFDHGEGFRAIGCGGCGDGEAQGYVRDDQRGDRSPVRHFFGTGERLARRFHARLLGARYFDTRARGDSQEAVADVDAEDEGCTEGSVFCFVVFEKAVDVPKTNAKNKHTKQKK